MSALAFIITRTTKNNILETFRKPAKLIMWIVVIAALVFVLITSLFSGQSGEDRTTMDLIWLKGICFAVFALFAVLGVVKGLSRGDAIFSMSDVNLLFVSPTDPSHILFYGIVQMAKMSMAAGFFILFQVQFICVNFGVNYGAVLLIFLGFILSAMTMQVVSLIIYSNTNGKPKRKRLVRIVTALVFVPLAAVFAVDFIRSGDALAALETTLRSPVLSWTPVAGWSAEGTLAFITGDLSAGWLFFGVLLLAAAALIVYVLRSNPDYFEDVLVATETAFEKARSVEENAVAAMENVSDRKIKISKTGIGGFGASAFFYKHLRESFRVGRLGMWGIPSLLYVAGIIAVSFFIEGQQLMMFLIILMSLQILLVGMGRGLKELYNHYIYMMPESSFSKMIWSNGETVLKNFVESVVIFTGAGIVMGESIAVIVLCIAVYSMFTLLLLGVNYLSLRFTGTDISTGLTLMLYFVAIAVAIAPGLAAALVVGFLVGGQWGLVLGLLIFAVWELIAACVSFADAKSILHNCDMMLVKPTK